MLSLENDQSSWLVEGLPTLTTHTWWHMPIILAFWSWEKEVWKFKAGPGLLAQWVRALAAIQRIWVQLSAPTPQLHFQGV